jgi:hypothetical protein
LWQPLWYVKKFKVEWFERQCAQLTPATPRKSTGKIMFHTSPWKILCVGKMALALQDSTKSASTAQ